MKKSYQALFLEDVTEFVIDLAECPKMNDVCLGTLLGIALKLKNAHQVLRVRRANPEILSLLKNLGLDKLIEIN